MPGTRWPTGAARPPSSPAVTAERRLARYGHAWRTALEVARRLVDDFGAVRVVAWGPLVHPERFTAASRVQLAVWGLRADVFPAIIASRQEPLAEIVDADHLDARLLHRIAAEGVELARHRDRQL